MRCPHCGEDINNDSQFCAACGYQIQTDSQVIINADTQLSDKYEIKKAQLSGDTSNKVPIYLRMWFISIVFWVGSALFGLGPIIAIILLIIRIVKHPTNKKSAILSAGLQVGLLIVVIVFGFWSSGKNDRAINDMLNEGGYSEAIEYVESNYDASTYSYYSKIAEIYERQEDYDAAAASILKYTEVVSDITEINDNVITRLKTFNGIVSAESQKLIDRRIGEIAEAKTAKEAEERKVAEEKAAREAAEAEAEEKKELEKAAAKATKEATEKGIAANKAADETTVKEVEKDAADAAIAEQKAQENEERNIIQNAKTLGTDLVMESHSSAYNDNYYKAAGTIEEIEGTEAYRIRYLSTVNDHKKMYKAWILSEDTSRLNVGENVFVVAKYIGFAEDSTVPTLEEYKMEKSSDSFYSELSSKAKVVNWDISFDELLRYGEYQEFVYVEGIVTAVYDNNLNISDDYGNSYLIYDKRVKQDVILQDDYIRVYGSFDGIYKSGYVWPKISWLVDGNQ